MKTIAILGGTFDPIHHGHLSVGESVVSDMGLGAVLLIPTGDPPHKQCFAAAEHRLAMATLAAETSKVHITVSDIEAARTGTTYTVDTLSALKEATPGAALYYIVGGDALIMLETWREFPRVASLLSGFYVAIRPGTDDMITLEHMEALRIKYGLRMELLRLHGPDISSTEIREAILTGKPFAKLVPAPVKAYIDKAGLYLNPVRDAMKTALSLKRYDHVLGTEAAAAQLAARYGCDISLARLTALLHDCAKDLTLEEMQDLTANRKELCLDDGDDKLRQLLHGPAGSVLAREKFGVHNEEILSAIRWHTTGKRGMGLLSKIIYVADAIDPTREGFPGLDEIRASAKKDLDETVLKIAVWKNRHVLSRGYVPSRHSLDLLNNNMEDIQ